MDENNNQMTGNGVYSYGEPASTETDQSQPEENTKETTPDALETDSGTDSRQKESVDQETAQTDNAESTEQESAQTDSTESTEQASSQTKTTDTQENKFAYQDNQYEYDQRYNQNNTDKNQGLDTAPMDLKDWVLTLIILMVPCVGIVMYFVWAFGNKGNINRRNFCRAQLIIFVVLLVIYLIFFALFGAFAITGAALY